LTNIKATEEREMIAYITCPSEAQTKCEAKKGTTPATNLI